MADEAELPIRLLRRKIGLSQTQLARLADVPQGSLSRLERGVGAEHLEARVRLALERQSEILGRGGQSSPLINRTITAGSFQTAILRDP
ncbi:helix-turn-helix domain-containing protein [Methylobacterium fujisawaense]